MTVEILSPEALLFKGEATAVNVPGVKGAFVILDHHAPIISMLTAGEVTLFEGKNELKSFTIKGGTLECNHNKVVILADQQCSNSYKKIPSIVLKYLGFLFITNSYLLIPYFLPEESSLQHFLLKSDILYLAHLIVLERKQKHFPVREVCRAGHQLAKEHLYR